MNRKNNNLAFFTLLIVGLFSLLTLNIFAQKTEIQKTEQPQRKCTGEKFVMPLSIAVGDEGFANFIKVLSLPTGERQKSFSEISNGEKADVVKVQLALQFIKRPQLTKEQKDLILETISKTSADIYDKRKP